MQNPVRRRKGAYHADTQEDYLKIATESRNNDNIFYGNYGGLPNVTTASQMKSQPVEVSDFYYNGDEANSKLQEKQEEKAEELIKNSTASQINSEEDKTDPIEKVIKIMLIGAPKVGKHDLIDASFPGEEGSDSGSLGKQLDLIVRKRTEAGRTIIYEFWVKELPNDTYEMIIKTYYKQSSVFLFVYDLTNRASFEALLPEIENVYQEPNNKKFTAFLIATHSGTETEREVSFEEGAKLKEKYKMHHFIETNSAIEKDSQQLRKKIDSHLSEL